ncbi:flagellar hook capping FlgD N-terminal domain-containing protein [Salipiger sp. PrR002]|uniref:flagellar hook capping FlgD N-terminal domain-containing protein n=1 Tax=Salipiger sp. PrR002 TaxID=2706489 RepID=UPI0013B80E22|nr:flagellar hook capping FlgD N-terminal domain-containing protein [Salipiger sp. PrR002]NDV98169.1 hypothetical protein [Salipiger sp. PrR002]NDW54881.1 hypothetical protein [Salipiger sp. PrR004]
MEVAATNLAQTADLTSGQVSDAASLSGDFETFLKMLTTQAQNQDPFNPVDATEYASQLASFSTVEQQVLTNGLLTELTRLATGSGLERLAGWIGMEALTMGAAYFDGAPVELVTQVPEDAQSAVLVIRGADGSLKNRIAVGAGDESYRWDGTDLSGATVSHGIYEVELEVYREDTLDETREVGAYLRVDEVARLDDVNILTLRGGVMREVAEVTALRNAAD